MCPVLQVYTVGPEYAHAEARKSPALDGKVERDKAGKEIRYPVILTAAEKLIARNICLAFKVGWCHVNSTKNEHKHEYFEFTGLNHTRHMAV